MRQTAQVLCANCRAPVTAAYSDGRLNGLQCPEGHRFDAAKQGYVNMLVGRGSKHVPDTAEMVLARERAQASGVFAALIDALQDTTDAQLDTLSSPALLDCGAGTGHYLAPLLRQHHTACAVALDLSPAALKRAAKLPRTLALAWDLWRELPVASGVIDLLLNIFAPRNPSEFRRVLRPGGMAVIVTPGADHLRELAEVGLLNMQEDKHDALIAAMRPHLGSPSALRGIRECSAVPVDTAVDLVMMGPAGHHRRREDVASSILSHSDGAEVAVTVNLQITVFSR
ncbi:methyltransferase domain-containing protein [Nesterenkonia aerolata]|uniref:Methyltransferase domain-containing protein n=1 Tax=Nesterenkonia aerolata TaxID=3074079 RepID=A0ABU2DRR1_9MICC|nr:methyltransferase domain-containing protein [Nesterenkonia sp. LY-0111]MDR8019202.1 methyltransferase domain-containing protein [Nesterenkonia sp. LY-0111]